MIVSALRGVHPDMRIAYRHIALPVAIVAGSIISGARDWSWKCATTVNQNSDSHRENGLN